ncbi:MAG: MBL fold metallo-hydrolase [Candidatus Riflebacteria bacterium]|nr:MBL fold metallo-hydrolase [Candidatus Riflebacteria bacterium]
MQEFVQKNIFWMGHDSFKLVGEKTVFVDPYQIKKSEKADIICITHEHFDHCSPEDVKKLQGEQTVIVGPQDCLNKLSGNLKPIKPGEKLTVQGIEIEAVPSYNIGKKFHPKANGWVGYIITLNKTRIYHAGDTDHTPEMKTLKVDVALLPVSGTYVMSAEEAAQAALEIKPKAAIPMHYGSVVGSADDAKRFKELLYGKVEVVIKD